MANILVIDDNEDLRETLVMLPDDEGYTTIVASDGASGARVFAEPWPDLVIADIPMPESDGIETIRKIRSQDPLARSACVDHRDVGRRTDRQYLLPAHGQTLGAMEVRAKPFEIRNLVRIIETCLGAHPRW